VTTQQRALSTSLNRQLSMTLSPCETLKATLP
jgi:hypothetical protein